MLSAGKAPRPAARMLDGHERAPKSCSTWRWSVSNSENRSPGTLVSDGYMVRSLLSVRSRFRKEAPAMRAVRPPMGPPPGRRPGPYGRGDRDGREGFKGSARSGRRGAAGAGIQVRARRARLEGALEREDRAERDDQ